MSGSKGAGKKTERTSRKGRGRRLVRWLCAAGMAAGAVYGGQQAWLKIRQLPVFYCQQIVVRGNALLSRETIMQRVTLKPRTSIFGYDIRALAETVRRSPYVKSCVVKRRLPSTLVVQVAERVPIAYLSLKELYLVDQDRILLPRPADGVAFDVPVITGISLPQAAPGAAVPAAQLSAAFDFIRALTGYQPHLLDNVSEIEVASGGTVTVLTTKPAVRIRLGAGFDEEKLMKWNLLDRYEGADFSDLEYVDLRYKDQIIIKRRT